jgi:hypothetical protein
MTVVAVSWDQSLKNEAKPTPRTVRFSQGTLGFLFVNVTGRCSFVRWRFIPDGWQHRRRRCQTQNGALCKLSLIERSMVNSSHQDEPHQRAVILICEGLGFLQVA